MAIPLIDTLIRYIVAAAVGFLIGYTRKNKPAGLRTFALICLGSAIFTLVSIEDLGGDKTRTISQIVTGIGFLGAGVIWKQGFKLNGLTTAAAMWVTASIGVLIGLGFWVEALTGALLTFAVLSSKRFFVQAGLEEEGS